MAWIRPCKDDLGLKILQLLPTVRPDPMPDSGASVSPTEHAGAQPLFRNEPEYRFCRAVVENPLLPSSHYAKLAGMSPKTAGPIRHRLVQAGYIREHLLDTGRRGRSAILLEALPAGQKAVRQFQPGSE